jgi:hypothetical protein
MLATRCGTLMFLVCLLAGALPARAADVVYPPGSQVGLAPPPGMTASRAFPGFEDPGKSAAILVAAVPVAAFADFVKSDTAEALKRQGATLEAREELTLPAGKAVLVIGSQSVQASVLHTWLMAVERPDMTILVTARIPDAARDTYPDAVIRTALASVAVRADVPTDEQLALLPFRLGDLAGFKVAAVLPGRAINLTDAAGDRAAAAHIVVALEAGGPTEAKDREEFARRAFLGIPNLKEIRLTGADPIRIDGVPGFEIMATAKDGATGTAITLVQWIRFGGGSYMQIVGVAPTAGWTDAYERFRAVRDGIGTR